MLNKVIIQGRFTSAPEIRRTQSGTAVASFALAVERDFPDKSTGQKQTDFIPVIAGGNTAEFVSKYFTKGSMIVVEGRLQVRDWQDKDGNKRYSTEVVAQNVYFAGSKKRDADSDKPAQRAQNSAQGQNYSTASDFETTSGLVELTDDEETLPF
jgi:single-strand DNA-binding protein